MQAAGAAILVPTSLALLLPEFPLEQRATATALWGAAGGIAAATGPALGGVLVAATSWRSVFFVNLAIGLPALIPARRLLRESRDPNPGPLTDILGIVLLVAGVGLLSLGIVKGQDWGWGSAPVVGSLAASALALAAFVARSARHPAPVIELGLLRVRSFAVANAGVFLFALGFYAVLLANILFLTSVWGWSVLRAGIAVTPGPLMAALSATAGGRLADRYGQRVVALPGGLLFAAGCLVFATGTGATPALRQRVPARDAAHRHGRRPELRGLGQRRRRRAPTLALRDRQRDLRHLAPDRRGARHRRPRRGHRHPAPRGRGLDLPHRLGAHGHPGDRRRPHGPGPRPRPRAQPRGGGGAGGRRRRECPRRDSNSRRAE